MMYAAPFTYCLPCPQHQLFFSHNSYSSLCIQSDYINDKPFLTHSRLYFLKYNYKLQAYEEDYYKMEEYPTTLIIKENWAGKQ